MALVKVAASTDPLSSVLPAPAPTFRALNRGAIPNVDGQLLAAVAAGPTLLKAQVAAPSMEYTPANIQPLNAFPWPTPIGSLFNGGMSPKLRGDEAFELRVLNNANEKTGGVVWVRDRLESVPQGESFLLEFETVPVTLEVGVWAVSTLRFGVPFLPTGRYHVLGMEAHEVVGGPGNYVAARLVIPNQTYRPGTVVTTGNTQFQPGFLMDGSMGSWGSFEQQIPP